MNGSAFATAVSLCISALAFSSHAYAGPNEETGMAAAFDDERKSSNDLCREAREDAQRKVPKGAKNVKYSEPVFKGQSLRGKPAHNCVVYVYFERGEPNNDDINPYKLENQLTPPPPKPQKTAAQRECEKYNGTWVNGRCKVFCEGKPPDTEIPNAGGARCGGD